MGRAQSVAERIWESALKTKPKTTTAVSDWLTSAINDPAGKLAEFWLHRISAARKPRGNHGEAIPQDIVGSLSAMLRSSGEAAANIRIVFASQLHYFFALDRLFTEAELLPLFNWQTDELTAEQCWQGFFWWGRWPPGLTERLLPHFWRNHGPPQPILGIAP